MGSACSHSSYCAARDAARRPLREPERSPSQLARRSSDPPDLEVIYAPREVRNWTRYMSYPELKAELVARSITSLAQFYTREIKYDPDTFRRDSAKVKALLEAKHFLP